MLAATKVWPWRGGLSSEGFVLGLMTQKIRDKAHTPGGVEEQAQSHCCHLYLEHTCTITSVRHLGA